MFSYSKRKKGFVARILALFSINKKQYDSWHEA